MVRPALPSSPCPAWPRSEEGAPPTHCEEEGALRMQEPLLYRRAERPKRRRNQAREGQVAQASCAETFCPPAAKTGAAQPEGRTMLSKPSARRVERARRGRRAGAGGATVPSATSVRAGGSLSPSVSHTVVAWRCLEDRTLHRSTASSVRTNACEGRPDRGPSLAPRRVLALTRARAGDKKITTRGLTHRLTN